MKTMLRITVVFCVLALIMAGCTPSMSSLKLNKEKLTAGPCESLTAFYSKTYFQERFMGKSIGIGLVFGPLLGSAIWSASGNYEGRTKARLESNAFEKLLGSFDVSEYLTEQFEKQINASQFIKINSTRKDEDLQKIIKFLKCENPKECGTIADNLKWKFSCATALKMAYGLGARQGGDQFGFSKSYRPFIRLIGASKSLHTNEMLWQDDIIVFGEKAYKGDEADANRIDREDLVSAFKNLSSEAIALLIKSLNGEKINEMPVMVDTTNADLEF